MRKSISWLFLVGSIALVSCDSSETHSRLLITTKIDAALRQVMALGDNPLKVVITVNTTAPQIFQFNDASEDIKAAVTGVRNGERNNISITWIEVLNGFDVEISRQQQSFMAAGEVTIDAEHSYLEYDYDGDGESNYDERLAETCVWVKEDCDLDVPPSLIRNGDFSIGNEYWSVVTQTDFSNGEVCVSSSDGQTRFDSYLLHTSLLTLRAGLKYTVYADIRSLFPATPMIRVETHLTFIDIYNTPVQVSPTPGTFSVSFVAADNYDNALLGFSLGDGTANRYCFDNIRLVPELAL